MAIEVVVPALGESVTQAVLLKWHKADGESVAVDEPVCELETDKANVDVPSPAAGVIRRSHKEGDTVNVGEVLAQIEESAAGAKSKNKTTDVTAKVSAAAPTSPAKSATQASIGSTMAAGAGGKPADNAIKPEDLSPAVRRVVAEGKLDASTIQGTGPGGRITKEDAVSRMRDAMETGNGEQEQPERGLAVAAAEKKAKATATVVQTAGEPTVLDFNSDGVHRAPMSKLRKRIAERLVSAQQTAAILTTFNEVDMSGIIELRTKYKEQFEKMHGIGLGFMSFFSRACVLALKEYPRINAFIEGDEIIYHNYVHLGIAVSTERGLAVPVLRNVQDMSFARIETEIKRLAAATRDGKLSLEELSGGTFTITNGGVFGSLLSTPIINFPQSGILGMHAIQKRPVAIGDKVEIRPMMYIALSYDHRLVDGRESVSFLVRLKQLLEDPARLMLEI